MQFYCRQNVYRHTYKKITQADAQHPISEDVRSVNEMHILAWNPFQSFVVFLGILHVQLNAIEDIMQNYHVSQKFIYEDLFTNCVLAIKPKPWRSNSVLEIVYGGWTLVKDQVIETFKNCKSIAYGILLTLLDSYIPLAITIFSVTFKTNQFDEFEKAMARIWCMFLCFY